MIREGFGVEAPLHSVLAYAMRSRGLIDALVDDARHLDGVATHCALPFLARAFQSRRSWNSLDMSAQVA